MWTLLWWFAFLLSVSEWQLHSSSVSPCQLQLKARGYYTTTYYYPKIPQAHHYFDCFVCISWILFRSKPTPGSRTTSRQQIASLKSIWVPKRFGPISAMVALRFPASIRLTCLAKERTGSLGVFACGNCCLHESANQECQLKDFLSAVSMSQLQRMSGKWLQCGKHSCSCARLAEPISTWHKLTVFNWHAI